MKTQLFIENQEVELTDDIQFLLNKQFEDIANPTVIINDWSKTISIPFSEANNRLFGYIYRPDRIILSNGNVDSYKLMNMYFDPTKKLDFKLVYNTFLMMSGYAKMNEIKQTDGKGTYELTLFGQLGKVFQEMQKITFDKSYDASNYVIDGAKYVSEYINKDLVTSSWQSSGQEHSELYPKYIIPGPGAQPVIHPNYKVTDIIGFAPNNAFCEDFDYKTYQTSDDTTNTFVKELGDSFETSTGITADNVIPNGLLPREIGEYRSYQQLPFIYWNKLFKVFQEKAEQITGYQFELDSSWFNTSNPYWYNLVYMLKGFPFSKKGQIYKNYYNLGFGQGTQQISSANWEISNWQTTSTVWQENRDFNYFFANESSSQETLSMCDWGYEFSKWNLPENSQCAFMLPMSFQIVDTAPSGDRYLSDDNALLIKVAMKDENNNTLQTKKVLVKKSTSSITETDATVVTDDNQLKVNNWTDFEVYFNISQRENLRNITFHISMQWKTTSNPSTISNSGVHIQVMISKNYQNAAKVTIFKNMFKSNSYFTLNDLWNNEYNIFTEIIKYCKMYRIGISVDEAQKKIIFQPFTKYFENYNVLDWTDKIDKSQDFTITPVTLENKYVLFNYDENKTPLCSNYKEKYGVNYGEYRLITEYNFNNETKSLFDKVKTSLVNTDNVLSWTNLFEYHKIIYSFPAEIFIYNKDKSNKQVDVFGSFYFHNGLADFSTEEDLHLRPVIISDDTLFQQSNNTYFYTQWVEPTLSVTTYPKLDIVKGKNICLFNIPKQNFTYKNNYATKYSIYYNFWEKYIDERYNIQNKKLTCYMNLKPSDYCQFKWSNLIKIDNQLYIVNKIYDYNITSNKSTKVELITIQDINSYYIDNNYYHRPYISFDPSSIVVIKDETTSFLVKVLTNFYDVNMLTSSIVQWYDSSTGQWSDSTFKASSNIVGFSSGSSNIYNEANEDREFTIRIRTINPTASGNITFFESEPVSQYYYLQYNAINNIA